MLQKVQVAIADGRYATALREALTHSCAWRVEAVDSPDPSRHDVMVLDEVAFARLPLPLSNPERVVLISQKEAQDPQTLAQAWDAGILSVVSEEDPISTVLLAIMAAALRVEKPSSLSRSSEITPNPVSTSAPISPLKRAPR
jgi:cell division septation protein DedD